MGYSVNQKGKTEYKPAKQIHAITKMQKIRINVKLHPSIFSVTFKMDGFNEKNPLTLKTHCLLTSFLQKGCSLMNRPLFTGLYRATMQTSEIDDATV